MTQTDPDAKLPKSLDFGDESVRWRYSSSAIILFFRIAELWTLNDAEIRGILALDADVSLEAFKRNELPILVTEDCILRFSYIIGICIGLHSCHGDALADRWIKLPNQNRLFSGSTPLELMIEGA
jgi:hypothetical protein